MSEATGCGRRTRPLAALHYAGLLREARGTHVADGRGSFVESVEHGGPAPGQRTIYLRADQLAAGDEIALNGLAWFVIEARQEDRATVRLVIVPEDFEPLLPADYPVRVVAMTRLSPSLPELDEALGQGRS